MPIAWTLPGSQLGLGTVRLNSQPTKPLTWETYSLALAARISRAAAKERPETAAQILVDLELETNLTLPPAKAGQILVENSDLLMEKLGDQSIFPVSPAEIKHQPESLESLEEENLSDLVTAILR
jgi:hypothetical protein